jgi:hypothetical protein
MEIFIIYGPENYSAIFGTKTSINYLPQVGIAICIFVFERPKSVSEFVGLASGTKIL